MKGKTIERRLKDNHPHLMRNVTYGCSCGDGRFELIDKMLTSIESLNQDGSIRIEQIKEKAGSLYVYVNHYGEDEIIAYKILDLFKSIRKQSWITCESCGICKQSNRIKDKHWMNTLCQDCRTIFDLI